MGSVSKYHPLDNSAPETVQRHDAPEVVPDSSPQPFYTHSSGLQPTALYAAPHYKEEHGTYYSDVESTVPMYDYASRPDYVASGTEAEVIASEDARRRRDGRRYCGMRKAVFIWVVAGILLLICIAAVLGGVLGTILPKSSKEEKLQSVPMTGQAAIVSGKTLYQYFQDPDGKILENSYGDGTWTSDDTGDALVTRDAGIGSPLAAISYPFKGQTQRQVFYISSTGKIKTVNRTETRSWGSPVQITDDTASSGGIGLSACWSDKLMDGIRVYYPSQYGYIQEVGGYFNGSAWSSYESFDGSDASSGVGCSVHNDAENQYLNIYLRDRQRSAVLQWWYDFASNSPGWNYGPVAWKNQSIVPGSDIAVCDDGHNTEYVFYQLNGGLVTRGVLSPSQPSFQTFSTQQGANPGSKLAATYFEGGATILFQNRSSPTTMWASDVSRDGVSIFNIAVT